jgi:hypothetical protein
MTRHRARHLKNEIWAELIEAGRHLEPGDNARYGRALAPFPAEAIA